jgi:glutaminyl-tRNA synthetase
LKRSSKTTSRPARRDRVHTRFPPEPNGYLHIGHAKSICLNFGLAQQYGGKCNLRFDDTNPTKEEVEYVDSIKEDVRWLGFTWNAELYASDYFEQLYQWAVQLIQAGQAYVCDLTAEQMREYRGTLTEPGKNSPYRDRSVEENLDLFTRMRNGEFPDGTRTLRAKIDMASPNINLRDPVMYRILHAHHHRTGDAWRLYPSYDWAHGQSDSIEGITHSICTLEFENHRPLYDWCLDQLGIFHPQQIEFARLNLTYTVMSKRKLLTLVKEKHVSGWDDPRMPTICGLRRRGYTPEAIREFCRRIGVAKFNSTIDMHVLENAIRDDLNRHAPRVMAVLHPLKVVITNYPEGKAEHLEAVNNPEDPAAGTRQIPFSRELYIEREDFMEDPPKQFYRLGPGQRSAAAVGVLHQVRRFRQRPQDRRSDRASLHLRPRDARRRRSRRPQGKGHHSLGLGGPRHPRRSAAVRPPFPHVRSRRSRAGQDLARQPQFQLAAARLDREARAEPRPGSAWRPLPVRTPGLLRRRLRLRPRPPDLQPHRDSQR